METYELGPDEGVLACTRQNHVKATWDAQPGSYLVVKFWSDEPLMVKAIDSHPKAR